MFTPIQVQQFQRDGFYIDRGVFSHDELVRLRELTAEVQRYTREHLPDGTRYWFGGKEQRREALERLGIDLPPEATGDPEGRGEHRAWWDAIPHDVKARATWGVNEITRPAMFHPELVDVFAHPRVNTAMNALLDQPRAWGIKVLWTPKVVGYNLGWHRDQMPPELYDYAHTKPREQDHVQFNAALNDDDCFLVVPGSHRRPLTGDEWHAVREDKTADLPDQVIAALEPGDILYMDAHALHRGRSAVEGDRLTLHYSAQSQWVPLKAWGDPDAFAFITSDAFIERLHPDARPLYERLRTAERTDEAMGFLKEAARAAGWRPAA